METAAQALTELGVWERNPEAKYRLGRRIRMHSFVTAVQGHLLGERRVKCEMCVISCVLIHLSSTGEHLCLGRK